MDNITTFTDLSVWEKLGALWLSVNADMNDSNAVKFFTDIGGVGDCAYVYCRVQSFGGCMVEVNGRVAFRPLFDGGGLNIHSLDLSGLFDCRANNRVGLITDGGAVRAVFFFGDADGHVARLSTDMGWSAVTSNRSFDGSREILDARERGGRVLVPAYPKPDVPESGDDAVTEANIFVNPVKVYADESRLRRVYDFGCELYGAPIITAALTRGAKVRAVCVDTTHGVREPFNPTQITASMFREGAKILICSGIGSDRLCPMTGAARFRYVYAYGDGEDYAVTVLAAAEHGERF